MPCYRPNVISWNGSDLYPSGKPKWKPDHKLQHGEMPDIIASMSNPSLSIQSKGVAYKLVPCRRCIGCRMSEARDWKLRMLLELDHHNGDAIFLTLTYDNEHLKFPTYTVPAFYRTDDVFEADAPTPSLCLKDMQDFMKRLRDYTKRYLGKQIRVFYCGEYGTQGTKRPHYHAIIFGISMKDFPKAKFYRMSKGGFPLYNDDKLTELWSNGHVVVSECTAATMGYCARYVNKKLYKDERSVYEFDDRTDEVITYDSTPWRLPEFRKMSNRPGIGFYYLKEHDMKDISKVSLFDGVTVTEFYLPHKILEKLNQDDPETAAHIKELQTEQLINSEEYRTSQSGKDYIDFLREQEQECLKNVGLLKRELDDE